MWRQAWPIWIIFPECEGRYGEGDEAHGNDHLTSINPISTESVIGVWSFSCRILVKSKVQPLPIHRNIPTRDRRPWQHLNEHNYHMMIFISTFLRCGLSFSWPPQVSSEAPYNAGGRAAMLLWHEKRSAVMTPLHKEALIKGLTN